MQKVIPHYRFWLKISFKKKKNNNPAVSEENMHHEDERESANGSKASQIKDASTFTFLQGGWKFSDEYFRLLRGVLWYSS